MADLFRQKASDVTCERCRKSASSHYVFGVFLMTVEQYHTRASAGQETCYFVSKALEDRDEIRCRQSLRYRHQMSGAMKRVLELLGVLVLLAHKKIAHTT